MKPRCEMEREMASIFEGLAKELEEMERQKKQKQKPKSFEELMGELDKVHSDAKCLMEMGLSVEAEVIVLSELSEKKAKIIEQMHQYVDTL